MSGLCQGTCFSNLKSVSVTVLEQLAYKPPKCRGHASLAKNIGGTLPLVRPVFEKFLKVMSGLSQETCLSNLKSVTASKLYWNNNLTIPIFYHRDSDYH